jgi:hypothetical protein
LVVWNMAFIVTYIYIHIGNNDPNWLSYFSEGLKPPTSCVLHLLQATRMRFQHVSTKPLRFFFNGCPKDFQIIHLGCHLCFGSQGLRGVIPHQNESRIEKCSNIYHSNIFFWAPSNDAVCAAFFGTLFGGPLGPPLCRAQLPCPGPFWCHQALRGSYGQPHGGAIGSYFAVFWDLGSTESQSFWGLKLPEMVKAIRKSLV